MNKTIIAVSVFAFLSAYGIAHAADEAASGAAAVPVAPAMVEKEAEPPLSPGENLVPSKEAYPAHSEDKVHTRDEPAAVAAEPAEKSAEHLTPAMKAIKGEDKAVEGVLATDPPEVIALKAKANKGDVAAQHELGVLYGEGQGAVARDYKEALKWHRMAAEGADADSQHYMGFSCENGIGGETRSDVNAAEWYLKAAQQGHAISQGIIGNMYANGKGVDQDYHQAYIWLSLAKKNGDTYYAGQIESVHKHIQGKYWKRLDGLIATWKPEKGEKSLSAGGTINFGN